MEQNSILYTSLGLWQAGCIQYGFGKYNLCGAALDLWKSGQFSTVKASCSAVVQEILSYKLGKFVALPQGHEAVAKYRLYSSVSICALETHFPQIGLTPMETEVLHWLAGAQLALGASQLAQLIQLDLSPEQKAACLADSWTLYCILGKPDDLEDYNDIVLSHASDTCFAVSNAIDGLRKKKRVVLF